MPTADLWILECRSLASTPFLICNRVRVETALGQMSAKMGTRQEAQRRLRTRMARPFIRLLTCPLRMLPQMSWHTPRVTVQWTPRNQWTMYPIFLVAASGRSRQSSRARTMAPQRRLTRSNFSLFSLQMVKSKTARSTTSAATVLQLLR